MEPVHTAGLQSLREILYPEQKQEMPQSASIYQRREEQTRGSCSSFRREQNCRLGATEWPLPSATKTNTDGNKA